MSSSPGTVNSAAGDGPAPGTRDRKTDEPVTLPTAPAQRAAEPGDGQPPAGAGTADPRRRTDPYAVAALVCGVLPLVPFALITGVIALIRSSGGRRAGRAAAVSGLVLAVAWAAAGTTVAVVLTAGRPSATPRHLLRGTVFALHAGQCADTARDGVKDVHVIPCAQPHQAEIYATFRLAGARWPGLSALSARARAGCLSRVGGYLNPALLGTSLTGSYVFPGKSTWKAGGRSVVCEIRGSSGRLTGSVRGLGKTAG